MIVSSVAPPTNRSRCERTVTRALTFTPIPSCATPSIVVRPMFGLGASITFGLMLVRTASKTVLPVPLVARSMAQARLKSSVIPALSAAIKARTTWLTSPPANHLTQTHRRICDPSPKPETEKIEKNNSQHEREKRQHCDADKIKRFHI